MDYGQLKARIASDLHRTDLGAQIPDFIESARIMINSRFDTSLAAFTSDSDTNDVLTQVPELYIYAALCEGYTWLHNGDAMATYLQKWEMLADRQNITNPSGPLNPYTQAPVIQQWEPS